MSGYNLAEVLRGQLQTAAPAETVRDIEAVTAEIIRLKQDAGNAILGIGDRLIEAKGILSHGEWLPWLTERVEFSESTAQRFMRLAREWRNPSALTDLGATKALTLLALPPEEREAFMEKNNVVDMTSRELEKAIRERDEARLAAETAQADAKSAEESRVKMEEDMRALKEMHASALDEAEQAAADLLAAQAELKELRARPVEVAVQKVVDEEAVARAREDAVAEMRAKVDAAEKRRKDAEEALLAAQTQLKANMNSGIRQNPGSDVDIESFKLLLEQTQTQINQLHGLLLKVQGRDKRSAEKLKQDLLNLADAVRRCAE